MNAALAHRGPDADGIWTCGRGALGHRRLSIIDLSPEANQPLLNEDGTIGTVVNGEIYNFVELRSDLLQRGHSFRSSSDSEVVVHLYEEYGAAAIAKLKGMFALAVWDSHRQRLVLARDRAGKKPLFYRRTPDGGLAFASELQALVRGFPEAAVRPNYAAIGEYLTLQYVPTPLTAYEGLFKLPAAHLAVFDAAAQGDIAMERYWSKPSAGPDGPHARAERESGPTRDRDATEEDMARELRDLLANAVRRRLVADVPVGAFLSGGVDSSAVVALMATQSTRPIQTFSIGFPDASDSELPWARAVAARYGTAHHEAIVGPDVAHILERLVDHHGEPFADSSAVATFCLAQVTKGSVTVALSGDGSDETFAGYTRYTTAQLGHVYDALPPLWRPLYRTGLSALVRAAAPHVSGFVEAFADGEAVRYPYIMCQFTPEEKRRLLHPDALAAMGAGGDPRENDTVERFRRLLSESPRSSRLGRLIDLDWQTYLVDDINAKVDIASMAHALEVRCPFLDTEVVEFAARMPRRMLMRWRGKHLLRKAVRDLVPPSILRRRKRGFGLPLRRWMKGDLAPLVRDVLLGRTARERGLFRNQEVERLVAALDTDRVAPDRVWTLLVLELWFRAFIDPPRSVFLGASAPSSEARKRA